MSTHTGTPERVIIFDTTLRDGEQSPGAAMTLEEKLEIAEFLDDMGVDIIEAGFPISSQGDFIAVREVTKRVKNAVIAGLSRAHPKDIDRCAEAVKFAKRGRVHTVIATSPLHMRVKLNMTPEQVIETSVANVTRARNQIDDVEWSAEDGTRSEMDFLCRIVEAVIKAGATTVNIPDTVGYTVPEEYTHFMRTLIERVPSSADHSTSSIWLRARATMATEVSSTCSGVLFSFTRMCNGEVAITVWTRPRLANFTAAAQRSMSSGCARDRPAMTAFLERRAISLTA